MKQRKQMTATSARQLLVALLVISVAAGGAVFYFGLEWVRGYSVEVSRTVSDGIAGDKQVEELQQLEQSLAQSQTLIEKANNMFASSSSYQSQALRDVRAYADDNDVTISSTDFNPDTDIVPPTSTELFSITLESPVSYENFVRFISAIEGNLPKMQILSTKITRPVSPAGDSVEVSELIIAISTR